MVQATSRELARVGLFRCPGASSTHKIKPSTRKISRRNCIYVYKTDTCEEIMLQLLTGPVYAYMYVS